MCKISCVFADRKVQIYHPIKIIEPKQTDKSLSTENSSLPSTSVFGLLHSVVPYSGRSRSSSSNHKIQGYNPSLTFNDLHIAYAKLILKDRYERLRLYKNKNK